MEPPFYYSRFANTVATRANLPHRSQRCACFVTFRLADSLPQEKLLEFAAAREDWLLAHPEPWDEETESAYYAEFDAKIQSWLDAGSGECHMADPAIRALVEDTLRHFDGERYSLYAFVVMPNHVHALFMPAEGQTVASILQSWKGFASRAINKALGRTGKVWQKESWDRLVRNVTQFNAIRSYIVQNSPAIAYDAYRDGGSDFQVASEVGTEEIPVALRSVGK